MLGSPSSALVPAASSAVATVDSKTLSALDHAATQLDQISALPEAQDFQERISALASYLKQRGAHLDALNRAAELKLRVEREIGRMLSKTVVPRGHHAPGVSGSKPTLPPGISKSQSHRWQRAARVPERQFENWLQDTRAQGGEITSSGLQHLFVLLRMSAPKAFAVVAAEPATHLCPNCQTAIPCDAASPRRQR